MLRFYLDVIESEIINLIKIEAIPILMELLEESDAYEPRAFYLKMIADYKRYLAEITRGEELEELKHEAKSYYDQAQVECENLFSTHPLRLATALNYSVFLAE